VVPTRIVLLVGLDNTLLGNDPLMADLSEYFQHEVGHERSPAAEPESRYAPSETSITRPANSLPLSWPLVLCASCTVGISTNPNRLMENHFS
jgi:hypothetical protein